MSQAGKPALQNAAGSPVGLPEVAAFVGGGYAEAGPEAVLEFSLEGGADLHPVERQAASLIQRG